MDIKHYNTLSGKKWLFLLFESKRKREMLIMLVVLLATTFKIPLIFALAGIKSTGTSRLKSQLQLLC